MLPALCVAAAAAAAADLPCTGFSARLTRKECVAWQRFYAAVYPVGAKDIACWPGAAPSADYATDPCKYEDTVLCSDDGAHIVKLTLGGRGLRGELPTELADLDHVTFLQLSYNNLTGRIPAGVDFSQFSSCGLKHCCYFTSPAREQFDESAPWRSPNAFACPLPAGLAAHCHAACTDADGTVHTTAPPPDPAAVAAAHAEVVLRAGAVGDGSRPCQKCTPASNVTHPRCDVTRSLQFSNATLWAEGHISRAYCTDRDLVVWSNGLPNHDVFLEEMPKPACSGEQSGNIPVVEWNTQSYAYRIPLNPAFNTTGPTNYTGAGALAMAVNGVNMYPILGPGMKSFDPARLEEDGHDRNKNMKLDGQLDRCNEHVGRGFDVHYHADPVCMYTEPEKGHSPVIGYAADGYPVYGKLGSDHRPPRDLDRCMGHWEDADGDGAKEYHYHTSASFPYLIECWSGALPDHLWEPGGQPGEGQWSVDNSKYRDDHARLLPCCDPATGEAPFDLPAQVAEMRPAPGGAEWVYAARRPAAAPRARVGVAPPAAAACAGGSAGLLPSECAAWQEFHDATGGANWTDCSALRSDPCSCVTQQGMVACCFEPPCGSPAAGRIVALGLQANGLTGALPASLARLTALRDVQLEGNGMSPSGRGYGSLGGVLPPTLPYAQYVGCGLEGNRWKCPLPPAAVQHCSAGQPLTCT